MRAPRLTAQDAGMLLVCLIWGINFSVTKLALAEIPPLGFTAVRFVAGSALLWAVLRWREGPLTVPAGSWPRLIWLGVVGNTLYQIGFMLALAVGTATNTALVISAVPVTVAVLGGLLGIERTTPRMRWGIGLGTLGVVLVVAARGVSFSAGTLRGDLLALFGVLCWSVYTLGLRRLATGVSPLGVTTITTITGTPLLVLAAIPDLIRTDWRAVSAGAWGGLAYATLLSLVVAYFIWNRSVRVVGGNRTAIYMCVTPLVAVVAAWLLLGEQPVPLQGLGAAGILAGVLLTRGGRREPPTPSVVDGSTEAR
jgi:drug/metabolite transporter (DMT)-like permease